MQKSSGAAEFTAAHVVRGDVSTSATEQVAQGLIQIWLAKSVAYLVELGRQHPLIGARELTGALLAEQQPRPQRRHTRVRRPDIPACAKLTASRA